MLEKDNKLEKDIMIEKRYYAGKEITSWKKDIMTEMIDKDRKEK